MASERTLHLVDVYGDPIIALLSLPGEELGDQTGNRRPSDLTEETVIQFYEGRSPAKPLGKLLGSFSPLTLERAREEFALGKTTKLAKSEVETALRWLKNEEARERAWETTVARPFTPSRPSALAERRAPTLALA